MAAPKSLYTPAKPRVTSFIPKDHATYGFSSLERILNCPPSMLCDGLPARKKSTYSIEGDNAHDLAALFLTARLEGKKYPDVTDTKKYPADMQVHCKAYAEYVHKHVRPYLGFTHFWAVEVRVVLDKRRDIWGTTDTLFLWESSSKYVSGMVFDFKYGQHIEVDSEENDQTKGYALATIKQYGIDRGIDFDEVTCHIFQPRTDHDTPAVTYSQKYLVKEYWPRINETVDQIEEWKKQNVDTLDLPEDIRAHEEAGKWCKFCVRKNICGTYQDGKTVSALASFKKAFSALGKGEKVKVEDKTKKSGFRTETVGGILDKKAVAKVLSKEEMAFIAVNSTMLVSFIQQMPGLVMSLIAANQKFPGVKVVQTSGKASLIKDEVKLERGLKKLGINPYDMVKKWVSLTDATTLAGGREVLEKAKLVIPAGVNYRVVEETDKRPAVNIRGEDIADSFRSTFGGSDDSGDD